MVSSGSKVAKPSSCLTKMICNKISLILIITLILTFLIIRISSTILHDKENYHSNPKENFEKINTPTSFLRNFFQKDIHHIHFGFIFVISAGILILIGILNPFTLILFASGTSMILDQIFPWLNLGNYYSSLMLVLSILLHLIFIELILILGLKFSFF